MNDDFEDYLESDYESEDFIDVIVRDACKGDPAARQTLVDLGWTLETLKMRQDEYKRYNNGNQED